MLLLMGMLVLAGCGPTPSRRDCRPIVCQQQQSARDRSALSSPAQLPRDACALQSGGLTRPARHEVGAGAAELCDPAAWWALPRAAIVLDTPWPVVPAVAAPGTHRVAQPRAAGQEPSRRRRRRRWRRRQEAGAAACGAARTGADRLPAAALAQGGPAAVQQSVAALGPAARRAAPLLRDGQSQQRPGGS